MANKENIKKWVEALRSGEYKQTQGRLKDSEGRMCCLGVACEIHSKTPGGTVWVKQGIYNIYGGNPYVLPETVANWLGIKQANPFVGGRTLVSLNDEDNFSFEQIANEIEKEFLRED